MAIRPILAGPSVARPATTGWPVGVVLGLAFALPTYAFALTRNDYLTAPSLVVFVPIILWLVMEAISSGARLRRALIVVGAILLPVFASMLVHVPDYGLADLQRTMVRAVACSVYVLIAAFVAVHPQRDDVTRLAFGVVALAFAALFVMMMLTEPINKWGRMRPGNLHPNWWGELFIVMTVGAALARPRWIFYGAVPLIFIGLYLVQARGALIATVIVVAFAILGREGFQRLILLSLAGLFLGLPALLVVDMLAFGGNFTTGIVDFLANDVLRLNDPRRGLGTGFTGRVDGYLVALAAFAQAPLLGVGFGLSNEISLEAGAGTIHNGHLQLLLELGLLLYPFLFVIMVGAIIRSLILGHWLVLGTVLAYVFFVAFSPRSINLSALSMVGWFMIVYAWMLPAPAADAALGQARRLGQRWQAGPPGEPADGPAQPSRGRRSDDGLPMPV